MEANEAKERNLRALDYLHRKGQIRNYRLQAIVWRWILFGLIAFWILVFYYTCSLVRG